MACTEKHSMEEQESLKVEIDACRCKMVILAGKHVLCLQFDYLHSCHWSQKYHVLHLTSA
jgi:hypothetical protein